MKDIPDQILGVPVVRVVDTWVVEDIHGRRRYLKVRTDEDWQPTIVEAKQ